MKYTFITQPNISLIVTGQIFPGERTKIDTELFLYDHLLPDVESGRKSTTVRYGKDRIRVPIGPELPFSLTQQGDPEFRRPHGTIHIPRFSVLRFGELTQADAQRDGIATLDELVGAIKRIYEPIYRTPVRDEDWVSIYELKLQ